MELVVNYLTIFMLVLMSGFGGSFWGRVDGGGILKTPNWQERFMCASPFIAYGVVVLSWTSILCMAPLFLVGMGIGQYFARRQKKRPDSREFIDPFVSLFFGPDPRFEHPKTQPSIWRCRFGMATIGLIQMAGPAIHATVTGHYIAGALFVLAGLLRAAAYSLEDTEHAEMVNGFQRTVLCSICLILGA